MDSQVRESLLTMLNDAKSILDEHNIRFWLEYGTLLGIIRSGDFIPWERDIDLGCWKLKDWDYAVKQEIKSQFQDRNYKVYLTDGHINIRPNNDLSIWLDINFYTKKGEEAVTLGWTFPSSLNRLSQLINHLIIFILNNKYYSKKYKAIIAPFFRGFYKMFHLFPALIKEIIINSLTVIRDGVSASQKMSVKSKYVENLQQITIFGAEYLIPKDTKDYLRDGYGEDWETPQKNWDWKKDFGFMR